MASLLEFLERTPPFWCYALAVRKDSNPPRRYLLREIAERSGLTQRTTHRIAACLDWNEVSTANASAFLQGCGIDIFDLQWQKDFVQRVKDNGGKFSHLTEQQLGTLNRCVQRLQLVKASREASNQTSS